MTIRTIKFFTEYQSFSLMENKKSFIPPQVFRQFTGTKEYFSNAVVGNTVLPRGKSSLEYLKTNENYWNNLWLGFDCHITKLSTMTCTILTKCMCWIYLRKSLLQSARRGFRSGILCWKVFRIAIWARG